MHELGRYNSTHNQKLPLLFYFGIQQGSNLVQLSKVFFNFLDLLSNGGVFLDVETSLACNLMKAPQVPAIPGSLEIVIRLDADEVAIHDYGSSVCYKVGDRFHDIPGVIPPDKSSKKAKLETHCKETAPNHSVCSKAGF